MDFKESIKNIFHGYSYKKYWHCRDELFNPKSSRLKKLYCRMYLSKVNRMFNAYIGYDLKNGNNFKGHPTLGHDLNGIIIAGNAQIGENCYISHQVTIGRSRGEVPVIGDNVYIGPGAKIFGGIHIGNNVRIGANCVVFEDIPDNSTVVLQKPRIIIKDSNYQYSIFNKK